jgi:hypothetical protein
MEIFERVSNESTERDRIICLETEDRFENWTSISNKIRTLMLIWRNNLTFQPREGRTKLEFLNVFIKIGKELIEDLKDFWIKSSGIVNCLFAAIFATLCFKMETALK